jgi:hypothetical protein
MRPCWEPGSSPLRSTPGRTRTCARLHVREVPSPLGYGGIQWSRLDLNQRPPRCERGEHSRLLHGTISVGPAGVEPAFHRVSDGCLAGWLRPETSALYGNRTHLTCSTDRLAHQLHHRAIQSAWRESNPLIHLGKVVPGPLGHRRLSKGGRSRTLCVRVGAALLSREHTPVVERKGQDSNLQGLAPRPASNRVPSCLLARPSLAVPAGFEPATVWLTTSRTTVVLQDSLQSGWPDLNRRSPAPHAGGLPGFPTS